MSFGLDVLDVLKAKGVDGLGDPLPDGYEPVACQYCTAVCNFEAMTQCCQPIESCPMMQPEVESNFERFAFIRKVPPEVK